jgi:LPS-assembly lipoprotein
LYKVLTIAVVALIAGCGFHLQGELTTPAEMERTFIEAIERNSLFHRELQARLRAAGVQLVETPGNATAVLTISIDETDQRVLSVSTRNVPTEFEVYYIVEYSLVSGAESLLAPQYLTLTRDYTYDETLVLGKAREEATMRDAIVQDLVRVVLKQLSSL